MVMWQGWLLLLFFVICSVSAEERCGTLEGNVISFDSSYLFFQMTYKDTDYWGGENNKSPVVKGCSDPISSVVFLVKYPGFTPSGKNNYLLQRNRGNAALDVREFKGANASTLQEYLFRHLEDFQLSSEATRSVAVERYNKSLFDKKLRLFRVQLPSRIKRYYREVFWSVKNGAVEVVFSCDVYPKAQGGCDQYWFDHSLHVQFKASYVRSRLGEWKVVRTKSEDLLESFIIRGK